MRDWKRSSPLLPPPPPLLTTKLTYMLKQHCKRPDVAWVKMKIQTTAGGSKTYSERVCWLLRWHWRPPRFHWWVRDEAWSRVWSHTLKPEQDVSIYLSIKYPGRIPLFHSYFMSLLLYTLKGDIMALQREKEIYAELLKLFWATT